MLNSNVQLWNDLGFKHVGRVVKCDQEVACFYDGDEEADLDRRITENSEFSN